MAERLRSALPAVPLAAAAAALVLLGQYRPAEQPAALGYAVAIVAASAVAVVAVLEVQRPWWGLLAWFGSMPLINLARAQLWLGPVQLIPSTLLVLALALGVGLAWRRGSVEPESSPAAGRGSWWALAVAAGLAIASTVVAPWNSEALNVTLHGVLEPLAVVGLVLALRPAPRRAFWGMAVLGASIVLGAAINLFWLGVRLWPLTLYERRILFARLTYFNVGIFADLLVISVPMLAAVLLLRRRFGWPVWVGAATWAAIGVVLVALFFTYTKSAWLSTAAVAALLTLTMVSGRLRQAALLAATAALLAVVVPYPY